LNSPKSATAEATAPAQAKPAPLAQALAQRSWKFRTAPFAHFIATGVFKAEIYAAMAAQFQSFLDRGLSEEPATGKFARTIKGYDAYAISFSPALDGPLAVFISKEWHDMLARLVGIEATGDINGGFHHHEPGSASGRPHNDLNPGWFSDSPRADGINVSNYDICDYHTGQIHKRGSKARETVRAAALLFYLNNPTWRPGDGGETGLYRDVGQAVDQPSESVPPLDNSVLLFECTPHSYHAFLQNRRSSRNSLIMWLHRAKAEVETRWGRNSIVYWPRKTS
jgi:hypothetical protein